LGVTAGVAVYKACEIVRRLKSSGLEVTVVMTKEAQELIKPILFQSLSGNKVHSELFDVAQEWQIGHISLAERADLVLIAPATANVIGKLASGIYDDLLTCVVCATEAPVLICPAMNDRMFGNPVVQSNIEKLKKLGVRFAGPIKGMLACGKEGIGCLAEVETIVKEALRMLA
jgi:phosphopantothenoylcysteine decarboxylase/phosphopantothenate--cysteine ligase